jgi:hypothetical protein
MDHLNDIDHIGKHIIESEVIDQSETPHYRFVCVDLVIPSQTRNNIFEYYRYLDLLVRDCQTIKKNFIKTFDPNNLCLYQTITKLVTFHYDIFNEVFDLPLLFKTLDHVNGTPIKQLMTDYRDRISISQRLWKKGELRNPEKILNSYYDQYHNIMTKIKKQKINQETVIKLKGYIDSCITDDPILKYLFGPKLWLHAHYLDHLQNIYYYLKLQDRFELKPGAHRYFCFMQDRQTNTILNGMLVNKNDSVPMYQEHIFIHHNLYDKLFNVSPTNISMYLHSYAYHVFSDTTKQITVFPLAVMYAIFMNHKDRGLITIEVQKAMLFDPLPEGFIYQPLLCIGDGNGFRDHWMD